MSRSPLGFHDWEAGPDYARRGRGGSGGFLQGLLKVFDQVLGKR